MRWAEPNWYCGPTWSKTARLAVPKHVSPATDSSAHLVCLVKLNLKSPCKTRPNPQSLAVSQVFDFIKYACALHTKTSHYICSRLELPVSDFSFPSLAVRLPRASGAVCLLCQAQVKWVLPSVFPFPTEFNPNVCVVAGVINTRDLYG